RTGDLTHALQLSLHPPLAFCSQAIRLLLARGVFLREALNPLVGEQSSKRAIKRSRAKPHPAPTQRLNFLHDRITVSRLIGQAQEDEEDRLREGPGFLFMLLYDMSHNDMLSCDI